MKVLIVDDIHEAFWQDISPSVCQFDYRPTITKAEAKTLLPDYEGLIIRSKFKVDEELINLSPKLQFIGRAGAGLDLIDEAACERRGISIVAANEGNSVAVAEHLMGMLLSLSNKICSANFEVKQKIWRREEHRGFELFGKTVGLIGYGHNGSATAERLAAFGCRVLVYDKYKSGFGTEKIIESSLEAIQAEATILTLHVPLTPLTYQWIDNEFISSMAHPFYLCNVARGEIVSLAAVAEGLQKGKILGACLDVLENEKLDTLTEKETENFDYLAAHPQVLLSPHVAGWTVESYKKISLVLREKLLAFLVKE